MSGLRTIHEVLSQVMFWSKPLAVVLVLLAGWVVASVPEQRLRRQCCRRRHPKLSHEQWLSESNIPLQYATPLALRVYDVPWLTTNWRQHDAGMDTLARWLQLQPA